MVWATRIVFLLTALVASGGAWSQAPPADPAPPQLTSKTATPPRLQPTAHAWTLDDALQALAAHPGDAYLQYVALQLARNDGKLARLRADGFFANGRAMRPADLFSLFAGTGAVQKSLQLDAMLPRGDGAEELADAVGPSRTAVKAVTVADLDGPAARSHPWKELLAGRMPRVSRLAYCVPEDFYFVEFRSVPRLLDVLASGDGWSRLLWPQIKGEATDARLRQRLQTQLGLGSAAAQMSDSRASGVLGGVAITGSDLFVNEGSDVTMLFQVNQSRLFRRYVDQSLATTARASGARRLTGSIAGVRYLHLVTDDRKLCVYVADPSPDLHVRSNSLVALGRVLETMRGRGADGQRAPSLGASAEFQYLRTLWPTGAAEEDGLAYLSDAFLRRQLGAQLKIAEGRRLMCYNHLRMIGHAAQLHRTQLGRPAASLEALAQAGCAPGEFNQGGLVCPCGGTYRLSADGATGVCSVHRAVHALTPCCELPIEDATPAEAEAYQEFIGSYNQHWRTLLDPIALRVQATPRRMRAEVLVLPCKDNPIHTEIVRLFGGKSESTGAGAVPKRHPFSLHLHCDKEELLEMLDKIGWSANNRDACLKNVGMLSGAARSLTSAAPTAVTASWDDRERRVHAQVARVSGLECACPEGGRYRLAKDGTSMACTIHGSGDVAQGDAPAESAAGAMRQLTGLSATLTFRQEGLQAVVILQKRY
jgi:hypothetical protein